MKRRELLRTLAAVSASPLAAQTGTAPATTIAGKLPMILHNEFPEDLEALPEYLATWITPNEAFFVRQHLPRPKMDAATYRLEIDGLVASKLSLTLDDLRKLPRATVPATLECAGNGRGGFRPRMPGLQWTKGAIGNAEWSGPRLKDVLAKAGVQAAAQFADFNGADKGVAKTPDFIRSIPMRKLLHESTILALEMNGKPLPELHGFPARLIVPGWDGASWVKWVDHITLAPEMNKGFYMNPAYRYPRNPVAPGTAPKPDELDVLEGMAVKSFFAKPAVGAKVKLGAAVELAGAAWAGEHRVKTVEISLDGGATWKPARLSKQDFPFAWRIFEYSWKPARPGYHTLCCRAADSAGRTQPIDAEWNPSGYLNNGIERLGVMVEA